MPKAVWYRIVAFFVAHFTTQLKISEDFNISLVQCTTHLHEDLPTGTTWPDKTVFDVTVRCEKKSAKIFKQKAVTLWMLHRCYSPRHSDGGELPVSLRHRPLDGRPLSAHGQAVGGVLNITACEHRDTHTHFGGGGT